VWGEVEGEESNRSDSWSTGGAFAGIKEVGYFRGLAELMVTLSWGD